MQICCAFLKFSEVSEQRRENYNKCDQTICVYIQVNASFPFSLWHSYLDKMCNLVMPEKKDNKISDVLRRTMRLLDWYRGIIP